MGCVCCDARRSSSAVLLLYISSREGRLQLVIFDEIILLSSNRTEVPDSVLKSAAVFCQPAARFD